MNGLVGKRYVGKILGTQDPEQRGRYLVHVLEGLPHLAEDEGIWCPNNIVGNRITPSDRGNYGSYMPLHPGTIVYIECYIDDWNSARITSVVSDQELKSDWDIGYIDSVVPTGRAGDDGERNEYELEACTKEQTEDRDEQYVLVSTPNKTVIYVNENSKNDPESVIISYKGKETAIKINEDGIHLSTDNNFRQRILINREIVINGESSIMVTGGDYDISITDGDCNLRCNGTIYMESIEDFNITSGGKFNLYSEDDINIKTPAKINVTNEDDINVISDGKISIENKDDIFVKSEGKINTENQDDINIKSEGKINVENQDEINVKSQMNINLESLLTINVKSALQMNLQTVDFNLLGSGPVKIAGVPVMLNSGAGPAESAGSAESAESPGETEKAEPADPMETPVGQL